MLCSSGRGFKADTNIPGISAKLRQLFGSKEAVSAARAVRIAGDLSPAAVEEVLWPLHLIGRSFAASTKAERSLFRCDCHQEGRGTVLVCEEIDGADSLARRGILPSALE
jgi:hypothetical protein